jgi:hypothetical protein
MAMGDEVPQMFWYLFWVGVLAFMVVFSIAMAVLISRRTTKALELLKLYAERGIDPPPTLAELLTKPPCGPGRPTPGGGR